MRTIEGRRGVGLPVIGCPEVAGPKGGGSGGRQGAGVDGRSVAFEVADTVEAGCVRV